MLDDLGKFFDLSDKLQNLKLSYMNFCKILFYRIVKLVNLNDAHDLRCFYDLFNDF